MLDVRSASPLLDLLFEDELVGRCLVAPDGSVLRANRAWLRSTGFRLDDVLGANILELFPETRDLALALHARARAGHRVEVPRHAQRLQGRETWWEGSIDPVPMENGIGLLISAREVGAAGADPRARDGDARFRALFEHAADAILLTDPEGPGRVLAANPAACRLFGYGASEFEGVTRGELFLDLEEPALRAALAARSEGRHAVAEVGYRRKDGRTFVGELATALYEDDAGRRRGIAIIRDVTERRRTDEVLRRYELVVLQSRDVILFLRREDGRIVEANPAASVAYGYGHEELLGLTIDDLRDPATRELSAAQLGRADAEGVLFEAVHRRKDGSSFPVEVSSRGAWLGGRRMLVSVIRDIGARRLAEAREREQRLQAERRAAELDALLDSIAEPLVVSDAEGRLTRANPAFQRLFGDPSEWTGMGVAERLRRVRMETPDGQALDPARSPGARALRGEVVHGFAQRIYRPDGTVVATSTSSAPIRTADGIVGAVVVFADVTEQQRAADALREADRRKTEFLAVLSHELRNPLAPIRNSVHVLRRAAPGSEPAARAQLVIERQTDHLARLVDDLLDVVRVTSGKVELQRSRVDLRGVVEGTMEDLRGMFQRGGIELRLEPSPAPVWVDADATRIAQVMGNLLQNSLKFTPPGGAVTVSVRVDEGLARVAVADSGIGMAPAEVESMFEPFAQAEQGLARTRGGLGLGLFLVRSLVELHGGTVSARSEGPGRGSEFVVSMPLAKAGFAPPAPSRAGAGAGLEVLVIEDNADAAQSLADLLAFQGYRVRVAADGRTGLRLAREQRPDVVVCDIGLPDLDGYAVARALRADPSLAGARLVALTGYAQSEDRERALEAGFDAHLPKPPDLAELIRALSR